MGQTLEEMRTLADNMLPDEDPLSKKDKGKQPTRQQEVSSSPESAKASEASTTSLSEKLKRKAVVPSDTEPEEDEEHTTT